jgi:hypothetical protein
MEKQKKEILRRKGDLRRNLTKKDKKRRDG